MFLMHVDDFQGLHFCPLHFPSYICDSHPACESESFVDLNKNVYTQNLPIKDL